MSSNDSDSPISSLGSLDSNDTASEYCPSDSDRSLEMNSETPEGAAAQAASNSWDNNEANEGAGQASGVQDSREQDFEPSAPSNQFDLSAHSDITFANGGAGKDVGEYDPSSVAAPEHTEMADSAPKTSSQQNPKKRKTAGGFIESDSEGEDAPQPASGNVPEPAAKGPSPTPQPALNTATSTQEVADGGLASNPPVPQVDPAAAISFQAPSTVAVLEARIKDDPRGATDQWLALMAEHRQQENTDAAREVYERFLEIFPQSADIWCDYLEMEMGLSNMTNMEAIFGRALNKVFNVRLWTMYLDYIRRRNDINNDPTGSARQTLTQTFEFIIAKVGIDRDSSKIWQDFIQFVRSAPGTIGGTGWQDQQKMDQLRKAYQRAICVPLSNVNMLWKEYDQFEMGLNKVTGRKFLAERSPAYMSAKSSYTALDNLTRGIQRSNIPRLPPHPGFDGDSEYAEQVDLWNKWIAWEKSDPLELRMDEPQVLQQRILYCYRQALLALRFWPEMWVDAAEWCFANNVTEDSKEIGMGFLTDGIEANPESILLALKHADRLEMTIPDEDTEQAKIARGDAVRAPLEKVLNTLYGLGDALKAKEKVDVARLEESLTAASAAAAAQKAIEDEDNDYAEEVDKEAEEKARADKIAMLRQSFAAQSDQLSKSITYVWTAVVRAMRRIQGKGDPKQALGGMRKAFNQARQRGRLGSEIYTAVAKMEWKCYGEKAAGKILERGAKLFPEDPHYMVQYLEYMIAHGDATNSRVVFETCVNRLTSKPESVHKAKPLLTFMHKHESDFGDLSRVAELEARMASLYPDDPKLALFSARFSTPSFNPIAARIVISPLSQLRPKNLILPSIEPPGAGAARYSPLSPNLPSRQLASPRLQLRSSLTPKRPLDDADDFNPRKIQRNDQPAFQRGVSPLKGAAGRRLDQQRRLQGQGPAASTTQGGPLPSMVNFYLGVLPPAHAYQGPRHSSGTVYGVMQNTNLPTTAPEPINNRPSRPTPSHAAHLSGDYGQRTDSPGLGGSAYSSTRAPLSTSTATYRQGSQRPPSRDAYDSGPSQYAPPPMPMQYNDPPPQAAWMPPPFPGGPPPPLPPGGFPPSRFPQGLPPPGAPPPPGPYSGYRY